VAVKKVAADEHHGIPHSFANDTPSLGSAYTGRSSATGTGRGSSRNGSSRGSNRTSGSRMKEDLDVAGKIIELDDEDGEGSFANLGATGQMFDMLQRSVCPLYIFFSL
jgi:hypothetical protein